MGEPVDICRRLLDLLDKQQKILDNSLEITRRAQDELAKAQEKMKEWLKCP